MKLFAPLIDIMAQNNDIDGLIQALFQNTMPEQLRAIQALVKFFDSRAIEPLAKALQDSDYSVRWNAAYALGIFGDSRAAEYFAKILYEQEIPFLRVVDEYINKDWLETAAHVLLQNDFAENSFTEHYHADTAFALLELNDSRGLDYFISLMQGQGKDRDVAAYLLAEIDCPIAGEYLTNRLQEYEKIFGHYEAAAQYLSRMDDPRCLDHLYRLEDIVELAEWGDPRAIKYYASILTNESNEFRERKSAAKILGSIGGAEAVDALAKYINDKDFGLRSFILGALTETRDRNAVKPLIQMLLHDKSWEIRDSAAGSLFKIGDATALPALRFYIIREYLRLNKILSGTLADRIKQAKWAIEEINYRMRPVESLLSDLANQNERWRAAQALATQGNPKAIETLIAFLNYTEVPYFQREAAELLGKIGNENALPALDSWGRCRNKTSFLKGTDYQAAEVHEAARLSAKKIRRKLWEMKNKPTSSAK